MESSRGIQHYLRRQNRRHILGCLRRELMWVFAPLYLLFGIFDYLYAPHHVLFWFFLRTLFFSWVLVVNQIIKISIVRKKYLSILASGTIVLASNFINIMIYQSGGFSSLYITGLILTNTTGIEIFRLSRRSSLVANLSSFIPTLIVIWITSKFQNWPIATIQSAFLIWMMMTSWFYRSRLDFIAKTLARVRNSLDKEIRRLHKTEFLKNHFPLHLRKDIEEGLLNLNKNTYLNEAVVGFADLTSSTAISNSIALNKDWKIKEDFLSAATKRATQSKMVVLTHLGDGFLFIANFDHNNNWPMNLVTFFENLMDDFEKIKVNQGILQLGIDTGVKCGVALGPSIVGFIGEGQTYFTAMGPDVNLASRLCGQAENNQMVVSGRVWNHLYPHLDGWGIIKEEFALKGFSQNIPGLRINRGENKKRQMHRCSICQEPMTLTMDKNGFFEYVCENDHEKSLLEKTFL